MPDSSYTSTRRTIPREFSIPTRCQSTTVVRKRFLRDRIWAHLQSSAMASFTLLLPLASSLLLPLCLSGARSRLLSLRLATLMMAFFPLLTSLPTLLLLLSSGAQALPSGARVRLRARRLLDKFLYTRISFDTFDTWGASPFLFSPPLSPASSIFSSSESAFCPRFSSFFFSPPPLPARASHVTSLYSVSPSSSHTECYAMSIPC